MKKLFAILSAAILLFACTTNRQAVSTKDIQGKYDVDLSSLLSELDDEDDNLGIAKAFASMLLSNVKMTMQFEENKLIVDGSGVALNLINAFSNEGSVLPYAVDYQIRNDSVLYTRDKNDEEFTQKCVLRKMGDSYDYLQMVIADGEETPKVLTLRRITEN